MKSNRSVGLGTSAALVLAVAAVASGARQDPVVDRVEEDWELVVATPDIEGVGPQITTCMSPVAQDSSPFVAFDVNYREFPEFGVGGLQLQVWSGQEVLATSTEGTAQLETEGETITWTQALSVSGGNATYKVKSGQSTTWGAFGAGDTDLTVSYASGATDLSAYSPDFSAKKSGVTWESNRVTSMTLKRVRYYSGGALILTDDTPRAIALGN